MGERDDLTAQGNAEALRRYWTTGPGGQAIRWGTDGSYGRCVRRVSEYMTRDQAQGFCAERHHDATGEWPAEEGVPS
jgi:hypothetical protein